MEDIYFYGVKGVFGFMSNFYKVDFTDEFGIRYCCSEQYFMFQKCKMFDPENEDLLNEILRETNPVKIKQCGRKVKNYDEEIWNNVRFDIMTDALRLKFGQNEEIKFKLLETYPKNIYEASKNDKIWGIGFYETDAKNIDKSKYGLNLLGKALMKVRDEFLGNI